MVVAVAALIGAVGADGADAPFPIPEMNPPRKDVAPFEYVDVGKSIPNYTPSRTWGTQGEAFSRMQKPLSPEESLKHLIVPKGFHAELFVTERELGGGKPICMTWDERGRLWLALTYDYPNQLQPPGQGRDRIVICEDSDGDGRADQITVFAENLSIPSGMTRRRDGLLVFDAGQTVWLRDTDGDDKADRRDIVFGAWSLPDTHAGPSNMRYGLDNWIWATQGYNHSRLDVGGETHEFRQGIFRFRPDGTKLEFLRSTDNNTWGLGISEEGLVFGSTANRNPSIFLPIPNRYYEAVRGWAPELTLKPIADTHLFHAATDKVRQVDHHGGYTAAAGHALYTARTYPREYWNRTAFVCDPTGHLVGTFILKPDGAGFRSTNPFNLLASDDEWCAPTMAEVGPDGNVWVIDWYSYIVQHNPTPRGFKTGQGAAYETDLRDKKHARVYRIVHDGAKPAARSNLAGASPERLVATLKNDNLFWRTQAQRLLVERGQRDVAPALTELVRDRSVDAIGLNVGAIHALWTLHGLGAIEDALDAVIGALRHPSPGVRRNAVQVLPRSPTALSAILAANLTADADMQVRLAALLALADERPSAGAARAALAVLNDPAVASDPILLEAATCAAANNAAEFLRAASKTEVSRAGWEAARIVAEHFARGRPSEDARALFEDLATAQPAVAAAIVQGLARGWPRDLRLPIDNRLDANLEQLMAKLEPARRGDLIKLAIAGGSQRFAKLADELNRGWLDRLRDESRLPAERLAAARELCRFAAPEPATIRAVVDVISPRSSSEFSAAVLQEIAAVDRPEVASLILDRLGEWTPAVRTAAINVLLARPAWTAALLDAAHKRNVTAADLSLVQQQALSNHPDSAIRARARDWLARGGALPDPNRQRIIDEWRPTVKQGGDVAAGQRVFKAQCAKCHVHGAEGERIGPDLTGMAVHSKEHLLAEILDPNRSVEANYRSYSVQLKKGTVMIGLLAAESRTAIELFDAEAKRSTILRDDIEELTATSKSLMPEGFEKQISQKEMADLLAFLTQRGRFLPLPLAKAATAISTRGMFQSESSPVERLIFDDWKTKTVSGVPFQLVDPSGDRTRNVIVLHGPQGRLPPTMPKSVSLPCNSAATAIHILGGISGWGFPLGEKGSTSLIVRLHYLDSTIEDHELKNGEHLADYIRRIDVPGSAFAFDLRGRQVRHVVVSPNRRDPIERIEFIKGADATAPIIVAVTVERPD